MLLKKVDRIKSVQEAIALQSLGIDFIGISLNGNSWFTDNRCIEKEEAIAIRKVLSQSKLVGAVTVEDDFYKTLSLIDEIGLDYIQVGRDFSSSAEFTKELQNRNVGIIQGGIDASYEDEPSWISINDELNASFYQIDLLGDMENAWKFFKEEATLYVDELLQIAEIEEIGRNFPVIITLDFTVDNILEIISTISSIKGICMTIAEGTTRNDIHYFKYAAVLEIVSKLNG